MFGTSLSRFKAMRPSVRSLLFIYWIYAFTGSMVGVFTQIFLYQKFTSIELNVLATILFYTGIMLGFCIPGFFAGIWNLNIKQGFMWSFLVMGCSLLYLLHISSIGTAFLAMLLWGFGQGVYWLTMNTLELSETKDAERDFYSSALNAGNQILSLAGPAFATLLIWLSGSVFHFGTFTLLFTVAPAIYLLGFFGFAAIRDYHPQPLTFGDVRHFFTDRRNQLSQLYTMGTGFQQILGVTVVPLAILFILGTALRVGIYDTFFAIFSAVCVLAIAQYRTPKNRLFIYGFTTTGLVLVTVVFGYFFTFAALMFYTIFEGILSPINNVSSHVIDLQSMEIGRAESDFYATMIFRDFFLWVWRSIGGILFLLILSSLGTQVEFLKTGLYLLAASLLLMYAGAYFLVKKVHSTELLEAAER